MDKAVGTMVRDLGSRSNGPKPEIDDGAKHSANDNPPINFMILRFFSYGFVVIVRCIYDGVKSDALQDEMPELKCEDN